MSIYRKISSTIHDLAYIWWHEMRQVFRDEGVFMFLIVVPLGYPLLYSWIYNNETVHEVPVVVVVQVDLLTRRRPSRREHTRLPSALAALQRPRQTKRLAKTAKILRLLADR